MTFAPIPRRTLLKGGLAALAAIPVLVVPSTAGAAVALEVTDPQAKALGFVLDTKTVDAKANPNHKPEQNCANCAQYKGAATDANAPCALFARKTVPAIGWCKVWAKRPA